MIRLFCEREKKKKRWEKDERWETEMGERWKTEMGQ